MKRIKPKYKQGVFICRNPQKYVGTHPIFFRSGLEMKFMRWLDRNPNVISWSSESVIIPYVDPLSLHTKKIRRYFVDNTVVIKDATGTPMKYLIEIKPESQTKPPISKRHTKSLINQQLTYAKNQAKWKAATEWCAKKGDIKFMIITEKDLNNL